MNRQNRAVRGFHSHRLCRLIDGVYRSFDRAYDVLGCECAAREKRQNQS
jgi:hypothetical protein